jgi:hypothetical protein
LTPSIVGQDQDRGAHAAVEVQADRGPDAQLAQVIVSRTSQSWGAGRGDAVVIAHGLGLYER